MQHDMAPTNLRSKGEKEEQCANEQYSRRLIDIRRGKAQNTETERKQRERKEEESERKKEAQYLSTSNRSH